MFAVMCCHRGKNRSLDEPCLDPLSYGRAGAGEPYPDELLRRGRATLFSTREEAERALRKTGKANAGNEWLKTFAFLIVECDMVEVDPTLAAMSERGESDGSSD